MTRRTEWPDSPAEPGGDAGSGYGPTDTSAAARGAAADDVGARSGRRSREGAGAGSGFGEGAGRRARSGTRGSGSPSSSRAEKGEPRDPVEQARNICLRLLTGTPRTRKQLADALRKREIPDEAAEEVLARFEDVGLIDDAAFAGAWVESRHHGPGARAPCPRP
ncbi:RecX family protein [Streptomyces sp. HB202]|nr:RecX family protein [Streptomyces sp. HB202]